MRSDAETARRLSEQLVRQAELTAFAYRWKRGRTYNFTLDEGQKLAGLFVPHESWLYRVTRDRNVVRNNTESPTFEQTGALKADAKSGRLLLACARDDRIVTALSRGDVFAKAAGNHMEIEYLQREINEILQPGITLKKWSTN